MSPALLPPPTAPAGPAPAAGTSIGPAPGAGTRAGAAPAADASTSAEGAPPAARRPPRAPRPVAVLALQARALQHERLAAAASAVADALARQLGCARVAVGIVQRGRLRVVALSHTTEVDARQRLVRQLAAALEDTVRQRTRLMYPLPVGTPLPTARAHAELSSANGRLAVCSLPLFDLRPGPDDTHPAFGALLMERRQGFDPATLAAAQDAATFVGPILALKHQLDQPLGGRLIEAVRPRHRGLRGLDAWRLGALATGLGLLVAALWPSTWRVVAPARVEGLGQQVLAAPFDGFVATASLRPGAAIQAGQVLLTLQDQDLVLEAAKWRAEVAQLDKKYREAQTADDATPIVLARAKLAQAQAQLDSVQQQLGRSRLQAPFDGVLLAGDFTQALGAPVKRGQELLTIAPSRQWRIVAEVDEQDIGPVQLQQPGQVLFGAIDGAPLRLRVARIAPLATVADGRNVFEVEGQLEPGDAAAAQALRPGQRGVVRIDIAPKLQGWIWWHRARQWVRGAWWRLAG